MDALPVEFHGACEWNFVPRQKLRVTVTSGASFRQIFLGYTGGRIARGLNLMRGPVAGETGWGVWIAGSGRFPVDALAKFLYFIGMALRALGRSQLSCGSHLMVIAVTGFAGGVAEGTVDAGRNMGSLVGMAGSALNSCHFGGVRIILDGGVAIGAA
jgi:hypothetical protein